MKLNIAKVHGIGAGLFLAASLAASAVQTTYQIDMGVQIALGNFNPGNGDTVLVAGTFTTPNWTTTSALAASASDPNLYVGAFIQAVSAPNFENHKFIINRNGTLNWETGGNRFFQVAATNQTLPVAYFNNLTNTPNTARVTFQVNMGVQIALGHFTLGVDYVVAAGEYNGWRTDFVLTNSPGTSNYVGTFDVTSLAPGSMVNYKFVIDGTGWESRSNRTFTNVTQTLPLVYFNDLSGATSIPVTFQVNLAAQIALGHFNPASDYVVAAGGFNNWSASAAYTLTPSPANAYIYVGTFNDTNDAPGNTAEYQYVIDGAMWETLVGNRQFTVPSTSQTNEVVYWNGVDSLGLLSIGPVSSGQIVLSWTAAPRVRLQSTTNLAVWEDVPNTEGLGEASAVVSDNPQQLFRLIGP